MATFSFLSLAVCLLLSARCSEALILLLPRVTQLLHYHGVSLPPSLSSSLSSPCHSKGRNVGLQMSGGGGAGTSYSVQVSYQNTCLDIPVAPDETILAALERNQVSQKLGLGPEGLVPSECRRGNCLTCVAKTRLGEATSSQIPSDALYVDDGLTPALSRWMRQQGYVLTCSTYVRGPGVRIQLSCDDDDNDDSNNKNHNNHVNHQAWLKLYQQRLESETTQQVARAAMARVIRKTAERNIEEWARETEQVLKRQEQEQPSQSSSSSSSSVDDIIL